MAVLSKVEEKRYFTTQYLEKCNANREELPVLTTIIRLQQSSNEN